MDLHEYAHSTDCLKWIHTAVRFCAQEGSPFLLHTIATRSLNVGYLTMLDV